jgi:hypothetical protein
MHRLRIGASKCLQAIKVSMLVSNYKTKPHAPTIDVRDLNKRDYLKEFIIGVNLHDAVSAFLKASELLTNPSEGSTTNKEYWETAYKARQELLKAISEMSSSYVLDNRPQIQDYLRVHRSLFNALAEGSIFIRRIFGHARKPHLELFRDPEEGWETLVVKIQSPYSIKKNLGLIERIRHEWLFNLEFEDYYNINALVEPYRSKEERE